MELTNEFVIDRPVDETWKILNDLEFIAPCMPGAQLTEIDGDDYRGQVKIKVGPITAAYKGTASFIEQDADNHVAKLKAEGRDPRQGNANALVTATMTSAGDSATTVNIHTDLSLSGKIASFGRGAIEDVSAKILGQFADNLRQKLEDSSSTESANAGAGEPATAADAAGTAPSGAATPGAASSGAATGGAAATGATTAGSASSNAASGSSTTARKINSPEPEPVDILSVTPDSVKNKALPILGVVAGLILLRLLFRRRGRD